VYPCRGTQLGYGDACAPTELSAIVDLSRMDRILEVNTELGYAVIEPGVSQQQLYDHLRDNKTGLWLDCTGAGKLASLVGNTLDRGFGHTRYGDHFLSTCGMEIVLADGRVLDTGFGHYANAKASRVYRYGVGPFLDGLFCQSNFGIVTRIGLWLMPEPEAFSFFFIKVDRDENLAPLIDRLRPLRMRHLAVGHPHRQRPPHPQRNGPLSVGSRERADALARIRTQEMRRAAGVGAWNVGGSMTGSAAHVRASNEP